MMEKLDFIEAEAKANVAFHLACADALEKQANIFLTVLLAGAGASFGYLINLTEKAAPKWLLWGLGAASLYLFAMAALTTWKCLRARAIYPPANEPQNLIHDDFDTDTIRRIELKNRQKCIDLNRIRNDQIGFWLNQCRLLTAFTPLVFGAAAWASCL
jgi:hypothetical protein